MPVMADIAYTEVARAPYSAMRTLRPALGPAKVRAWLDDPARSTRAPLYTLLLGIVGGEPDGQRLDAAVAAAQAKGSADNLSALLAAQMELRGTAALAALERDYFSDARRSFPEVQAALLAASVQGTTDASVPRAAVVQAYRRMIRSRHPLAGLSAVDLANWQVWDATPDLVALLNSGAAQHFAARYAVVSYLQRSPDPTAKAALAAR